MLILITCFVLAHFTDTSLLHCCTNVFCEFVLKMVLDLIQMVTAYIATKKNLKLFMLSYNLDEDYFGIVEHSHAVFFPDH